MFEVLSDSRVGLATVIKPSKDPLLFLAPGRLALAKLEQQLAGQFDAPFRLKDALAPVEKDYDYVVVDTPPSLGILTVNSLVAGTQDRKSTRLNSSHSQISYAVFCLKKKKTKE